nr:glutamic acid-rich protein-like [Aegilops tauschii subsp. strangulata]
MDYPEMAKMDFCEVIVYCIKEGAKIWQKHRNLPHEEKNKKHVNGLAQGPVIMYLDSLLLPTDTKEMRKIAKTMDKTSLPRANHLKESDLAKIARADMKRDGKARPDDYEFGKIQTWKGTAERIFYANTASTSSSIHQIAPQQNQEKGEKKKEEEDEERKRRTKSRDIGIDKNKIKRQKQERTNSTRGQDELQQQDGVNNPKNINERNKQSNPTIDNATTTTTPTQAQDTINVRTCEEITITSTKEKAQDIPADEKQETVIPDKETVDAGTNNPVINTEETNEYADLEDQELQTTTSEEAQEAQETINNQDHQTQPEEPNEQPKHVLQTIDNNATKDQATKNSLTKQQVPETGAATTTEKLQEKNKVSDDEQQNKEQEKDPKPPLNEKSAVTTTNTEREETNEQKEDTEEGQHVLQKAVINVTEDQAPKYSLTEKHAAERAAATTTEKLQDKNDGSGDELQKKEEEDAQKPPLYEEQAQHSAATIEELQDKNHDSDDEHQNKEQEDTQETTLDKEWVEQEVSANQVETEKQDRKDHQQDTTVDKEKHDAKKDTNDSNEDAAKTEQKGAMQKEEHNMPQEAEGEQERNNTGQDISSSFEAGTMEKGDKDSDSVNKAIEDLYNAVCKPWTQREMDELFVTTNKFDVNLGHVAESFKIC